MPGILVTNSVDSFAFSAFPILLCEIWRWHSIVHPSSTQQFHYGNTDGSWLLFACSADAFFHWFPRYYLPFSTSLFCVQPALKCPHHSYNKSSAHYKWMIVQRADASLTSLSALIQLHVAFSDEQPGLLIRRHHCTFTLSIIHTTPSSKYKWMSPFCILCRYATILSLKVLVTTIDAQWEGMGDVGSARYEPALLPPCPTIRVLSYSN